MRPRRLGISNYHLFWRRQVEEREHESAGRSMLAQFADDPGALGDLRALLEDSALGIPRGPLSDDHVLDGIARLLDSGELLMLRDGPVHGGSATQPQTSGPSDSQSQSPGTSSKSQAPENPSLPPTDGAAQASSLAAASSSGAPFCAH